MFAFVFLLEIRHVPVSRSDGRLLSRAAVAGDCSSRGVSADRRGVPLNITAPAASVRCRVMSSKRKSPPSKLSEAEGGGEVVSDGRESPGGGDLSPRPDLPSGGGGGGGEELQAQRRSMESVLRRLSSRLLDDASSPVSSAQ